MSEAMVRKEPPYPGELTEFDLDILGRSAVQLRIPITNVAQALDALRKLHRVTERAIVILEASTIKEDRSALFTAKTLLRQCAMSIGRVKRRRF